MENSSLSYVSRPSTLKENAPLMIMLHGYGSDENDLFSFASELPKELFIISVRAPYKLRPNGYAWYAINFDAQQGKWNDNQQAKESCNRIAQLIDEIIEIYPINRNNITLLGFSQGSILSYSIALSYPEKISNVIALSGYINLDLNSKISQNNDFSNLSFYCSHGSTDQVIPVAWARKIPEILTEMNIKHIYEEFPGGHGVSPTNFYALKNWLETHL